MADNIQPAKSEPVWHSVYPTPNFDTPRISAADLAELIKGKKAGVDYIVVDVRRTDFENTFVKGALNLPAHSFYPTLQTITTLLSKIPLVIFHCNSCTGTGRGPRTAGWYSEELARCDIPSTQSEARVLEGGIKEFTRLYGDNRDLVSVL